VAALFAAVLTAQNVGHEAIRMRLPDSALVQTNLVLSNAALFRAAAADLTNGGATTGDVAVAVAGSTAGVYAALGAYVPTSSIASGSPTATNIYASISNLISVPAGAYPPTNRTAYADPSFPLYSPPYFGNIQSALVWIGSASFPDGTKTNHGVLRISGQWSLSGNRIDCTSDKYDWLEIDAARATLSCDVSGVGDVKGYLSFGTGVERVHIYGGKWHAWQNAGNNGMLVRLQGNYCRVSGLDCWTSGSNWNATAAIRLDGIMGSATGTRASIAPGSRGSGTHVPLVLYGATSLVAGCSFDLWEKPNSYFNNLGSAQHQFLGCVFRAYNYTVSLPLFLNLGEGDRWEGCTFANVVNDTIGSITGQVALAAPAEGSVAWVSGSGYTGGYFSDPDWYSYHEAMRVYPFRTNSAGAVNCATNDALTIEGDSPQDGSPYDLAWAWTNSPGTLHGYRLVRSSTEKGWNWDQYRDVAPAVTNLTDDGTGWSAGSATYLWQTNYLWSTNAPTQLIGRAGDSSKTVFVANSVFNQAAWWTNCTPFTNFVAIVTNYTGIALPPPE
jgi:hypothetical protein